MRKQTQESGFTYRYRLSYANKKRIRKGLVLANVLSLLISVSYLSAHFQTYADNSADPALKLGLAQDSAETDDLLESELLAADDMDEEQSEDLPTETELQPEETPETPSADDTKEEEKAEEENPATSDEDSSDEEKTGEEDPNAPATDPSGDEKTEEKDPEAPGEDPTKEEETLPKEEEKELSPEELEAKKELEAQADGISTLAISTLGYDLDFLHNPNPLAPNSSSATFPTSGGIWPHIKTFGIIYDDKALMDPVETVWIAEHHDMVMSGTVGKEKSYDMLKAANPDIKLVGYTVVDPTACAYMEQWCIDRGIDPEKLYYHYTVDTTVNLRQFDSNGKLKTITIPGYPNGSATTVAESRVMETWGARNPSVCPTSPVLREAYIAFVIDQRLTVNEAQGKYLDGFIWDTYDSITDYTFDLQLQNTHEMQHLGFTDADSVRGRAATDLATLRSELEGALAEKAGKPVSVIPNAAEDEYIHRVHRPVYADLFGGDYDEVMVEYLTNTLRSRVIDSKHYMDVYDDMDNGIIYFINSETNVFKKEDLGRPLTDQQWEDFRQFTIAAQYLVLHPNAYFSYHQGSASLYQGTPKGDVRISHWNVNYEFDPGDPVVRNDPDAWGATGTDRFYEIEAKGVDYRVLAREFDNCLVIAKFGSDSGGLSPMGTQPATYQLGDEYRRLMPDNSLGPVITDITLCKGGGAILVKRAVADSIDGGYTQTGPGSSGGSSDDDDDSDSGKTSKPVEPVVPLPPLSDKLDVAEIPQTGGGDYPPYYTQTFETVPAKKTPVLLPLQPLDPQLSETLKALALEQQAKPAKTAQAVPLSVTDFSGPDDRLVLPAWILLIVSILILSYLLISAIRERICTDRE